MKRGAPAADRAAWIRAVMAKHEGPLVRYAARLTQDVERARDVVQEAFLRLLQADRRRVEPRLREWLFTVCRHLALDVRGRENRMQSLSEARAAAEPCPRPSPPEVAEQREAWARLLELVRRLPGNQQEVLRLKFQEGLTYREISRVTRLSVSHVGVLIHQALKTIRRRVPSEARGGMGGVR